MTSFSTSEAEVDAFVECARSYADEGVPAGR
jgi:hypothetical protein